MVDRGVRSLHVCGCHGHRIWLVVYASINTWDFEFETLLYIIRAAQAREPYLVDNKGLSHLVCFEDWDGDCKMLILTRTPEVGVVLGRRCLNRATTARFGLVLVAQSSNWDTLTCLYFLPAENGRIVDDLGKAGLRDAILRQRR